MTSLNSKKPRFESLQQAIDWLHESHDQFDWTGIYFLRGNNLELGPFQGAPTEHKIIKVGVGICGRAVAENIDLNIPDVTLESNYLACSVATRSELVCLIRDNTGQVLGQIDIDSHQLDAFTPQLQSKVQKLADELGHYYAHLFKSR